MSLHLPVERNCRRFQGPVVMGGPDPAGSDQVIGAIPKLPHGGGDLPGIVPDDANLPHGIPDLRESREHVVQVAFPYGGGEDLISDQQYRNHRLPIIRFAPAADNRTELDAAPVRSYFDGMEIQQILQQSETLIRTGEYDEAIKALTGVLVEEPHNLPAILTIGIAYTESGRNEEALRTLRYYLSRDAENDLAWEALGCAYLRMDRRPEAEEALETAREINPANAAVLRNLSILMGRLGRHQEAYDLLQESFELDGHDYLTMYALACEYRRRGRPGDAAPLFDTLRGLRELPMELREDAAVQSVELSLGW